MAGASRRLNDLTGIERYTRQAAEAETAAWDAYQRVIPAGSVAYQRQQTSHRALLISLLRDAMVVFRGAGDLAMVVDFGQQALEVEPNELLTLMVLAVAMSEIQPGETVPRPEHLPGALEYASRAVELLDDGLIPLDAPLSAANRAELGSSLRSTVGWIYYNLGEYDNAEVALLEVASGAPLDAVTHFRLGLVYSDSERWTDALIHLARAVYLSAQQGETGISEARLQLERVYQRVYGSLDGLDAFVAGEGSAIGTEDVVGE
jgi:tetratricopeptide (TPR) repeat protein